MCTFWALGTREQSKILLTTGKIYTQNVYSLNAAFAQLALVFYSSNLRLCAHEPGQSAPKA